MAAHQAPPSLGFSRQERWSGLPFPSPMQESEKCKWSRSSLSWVDSSRPHGLQPTRLLRPWDFPGKSTGWVCIAFSDIYTLLCVKQMTSKDLPYSTGNSTQYSIMTYMGKEWKKEWIYVNVWLTHFALQQKLTQHCKSIRLQLKKKNPNNNKKKSRETESSLVGVRDWKGWGEWDWLTTEMVLFWE